MGVCFGVVEVYGEGKGVCSFFFFLKWKAFAKLGIGL